MSPPVTAPEPRDPHAAPTGDPAEERIVAEAEDGIEDVEAEYGPEAPPRGATPGNPEAEEIPSGNAARPRG